MIRMGEKKRRAYEAGFIGKEVEVLIEEKTEIDGKNVYTGHTKEYIKIALEDEKDLRNTIVKVQIENDSQIIR